MPPLRLHTERLLLRPFTPDDLDALHGWRADPVVTRFLLSGPADRERAAEMLAQRLRQADVPTGDGEGICFAVQTLDGATVIGEVSLDLYSAAHSTGEIGYVIATEHSGRGYASEAATAMLRFGFERLGLHRVIAVTHADNGASQRVLRRLGMRKEAHRSAAEFWRGEWIDVTEYAMLAREWRTRAGR